MPQQKDARDANEGLTEAEILRRDYFREDGWHAFNNAQIGRACSPKFLIDSIERTQSAYADALAEEAAARRKKEAAEKSLREAQAKRYPIEVNLKILKLALSDSLDIPQ